MRLVTFVPPDGDARAGVLLGEAVVDLAAAAPLVLEEADGLRWDMLSLLRADQEAVSLTTAATILEAMTQLLGSGERATLLGDDEGQGAYAEAADLEGSLSIGGAAMLYSLDQVRLLAPLPRPASLRVYSSFEEHAIALASLRGRALAPAWYRGPAFAFANHGAVIGPNAPVYAPPTEALDFGLGLACVIGRTARDLDLDEATEAIVGFSLLNTWSARDQEENELAVGLGPAKSRDFATSMGPWLVTPDELELYTDDDGRLGLILSARVNAVEQARATTASQFYPFAELVAHASRGTTLYPGDVIGGGPVGGGTLIERTSGYGPWLAEGDMITFEATGLGSLSNWIE